MEEEIDLRQYVMVLLRRWKWIAGLTLVAAGVAFAVSMLLRTSARCQVGLIVTKLYSSSLPKTAKGEQNGNRTPNREYRNS